MAPVAVAGDWVIENATGLAWFEDMKPRHMAVNFAGQPCTAFGGDHLYYAEFTGAYWQVDVVDDSRGVGRFASLALRSETYPCIAYGDDVKGDLKYAAWENVGGVWQWNVETVDAGAGSGDFCSLALDSSGRPHIVYNRAALGAMYVRKEAGGWTSPVALDAPGSPTFYYSVVIDGDDEPHIVSALSVGAPGNGALRYSYHDAGGWHQVGLAGNLRDGTDPCLSMSFGALNCAFFHSQPGDSWLRYITFYPGSAALVMDETVTSSGNGSSVSTATLPSGVPRVAYTLNGSEDVYHATRTGDDAWALLALPAGSGTEPSNVSLGLNAAGQSVISYRAENKQISMVSRGQLPDSSWGAAIAYQHGSDASEHADLAVLGDGSPVIAYRDEPRQSMVARVRYPSGTWGDHGGDVDDDCGAWVSIAAAQEDPRQFHAAYYVGDGGDLRYQRSDGGAVDGPIEPDSTGNVGTHASLAVNPLTGEPAIAYRDEGDDKLKYVSRTQLPGGQQAWLTQVLDATAGTGKFAALAFDSAGHPFVGYRSDANGDVRVISHTGSGWGASEVVLTGMDPEHIAITIDSGGDPHLSFIDVTTDKLWYAWKSGGVWDWQEVTGVHSVTGGKTSILLNSLDRPRILFHADWIQLVRLNESGTLWTKEYVSDRVGNSTLGQAIRLARGAGGSLIAAYYDAVERDIMFAWLPGPRIVSIEEVAADSYQIEWAGADGEVWIDRSPGLTPPTWTPAAGPLSGTSTTIGETAEKMFYRVRGE